MKVELRKLVVSIPAITELASKPMKAQTAYRISKVLNEVNRHLKPYNDVRNKLIEKYEANTDGPVLVFSEEKKENRILSIKFDKEISPMLDEEVKLTNVKPISVAKLGNVQISPGAMSMLDWILEE